MATTNPWIALTKERFDRFSNEVQKGNYTKIVYSVWRLLKKEVEKYPFAGTPFFICDTRLVIEDDDIREKSIISSFDYKDGSLGEFLYKEYLDELSTNLCSANTYASANTYTIDTSKFNSNLIYNNIATSISPDIAEEISKQIDKKLKENKTMNTNKMFDFDFGPASPGLFRMSPYGLAVATKDNGWVSYDVTKGEIMNVDVFNFEMSKFIYKIPVAADAVKPGDVILHCGKPVFVKGNAATDNAVIVIDYANASVANILPVKSPFGFNFFTKITPLIDIKTMGANADNPFGNMLPFFLMQKDGGNFDPMIFFFMGNQDFMKNPMMLYFLMKDKGENNDILPFLLMMNGGLTGMGVSTPAHSTTVSGTTTL